MLIGIPNKDKCDKTLRMVLDIVVEDDEFVVQDGVGGADVIMTCVPPDTPYGTTTLFICRDPSQLEGFDFTLATRVLVIGYPAWRKLPPEVQPKVVVLPPLASDEDANAWRNYLRNFHGKPKLTEMAGNFAGALFRHVAGGLKTTPEDEQKRRLSICEGCDKRSPDWHCIECGCPLHKKTSYPNEQCPLQPPKWGPYKGEVPVDTPPPAPLDLSTFTSDTSPPLLYADCGCGSSVR